MRVTIIMRTEGPGRDGKTKDKVVLDCFIDRPQVQANFEDALKKVSVEILSQVLLRAHLILPETKEED
ncbi:hypothetical protein MUO79_00880 [Candidatus Bathyarchaeota archaeon]|nr:hypothetical protein [Candidatus Bathyarchaeota archaeon]